MMGLKNELNSDKQRQDENKATYCCQNSPAPRGILHHVYVRNVRPQLFKDQRNCYNRTITSVSFLMAMNCGIGEQACRTASMYACPLSVFLSMIYTALQ